MTKSRGSLSTLVRAVSMMTDDMIDLLVGLWITPTAYTIRHSRGYPKSALRTWTFQASKDAKQWTDLLVHKDDTSLNEPG